MADLRDKNKQKENINEQIRFKSILIITEQGEKIGPLIKNEALSLANENNLDLLQVGIQDSNVAIAKMLDYGKYKYEKKRKEKENKKKQVKVENKEIRLTVQTGDHDLDTKARKAKEFLLGGDRVKISLKFKGREITHQEFGLETLKKFYSRIEDISKIEVEPKLNTRFLDMYVVPKKDK